MKLIPEEVIKLKVKELKELAKDLPIEKVSLLNKEELCYKILVENALINGEIFGYGTLEILPDGYGFLRESSLEKDIYLSSSLQSPTLVLPMLFKYACSGPTDG